MHGLIATHWLGELQARTTATAPTATPFVMAGVEWAGPTGARIELRARLAGGRWTPWTLASIQGHDADGGTAPAPACFGEPVWTGDATALQIRADRPVSGLSVHLVAAQIRRESGGEPARRGLGAVARMPSAVVSQTAATAATNTLAEPILPAGPGQPPIIARSVWAGTRGPASTPQYGDVRLMFVHHSVGANGYAAAEVPAILLSIYEYHRYVRGWSDIGYNFAVDAYGRIWEARAGGIDQAVVGAQAGGYNLESAGAVMLGDFMDQLPTPAALSALEHLLAWKLCLHGVPVSGNVTVEVDPADAIYTRYAPGQHVTLTHISGHRQGCTTDCPGDDLFAHLPTVRANVLKLVGSQQLSLTLAFAAGQRSHAATYLTQSSVSVLAGAPVTVSGRLSTQSSSGMPGAAVPGASVEIESLVGEREGIVSGAAGPLDTVSTATDGSFSAQFSAQHNLLVRALHPAAPAVASPLLSIGVAPRVTLTQVSAAPLTVAGTVTPRKARVELRAFYNDTVSPKPAHVQMVDVQADGSFEAVLKLPGGAYNLFAMVAADAVNLAGRSLALGIVGD